MNHLECHACGAKFRSMMAEAQHRHNFPALCKRNKQFKRFCEAVGKDKEEIELNNEIEANR